MTKCVILLLLSLIWSGVSPSYNIKIRTPELESNEFGDDFKVAAELNTELNHDLWRLQMGDRPVKPNLSFIMDDNNNNKINKQTDVRRHATEEKIIQIQNFVGTNLFDGNRKKCFSAEDVALLSARRDFELLIPKDLPQCLLSDEMVTVLMQYFHSGSKIIKSASDDSAKRLIEKAFYDTLGGYLRYYVVPVTKLSFYAGKVNLKTVENVVTLYQQCKAFLNTNGNGWKAPLSNILNELKNVHIEPLKMSNNKNGEEPSCCANLDLSSVNNDAEDEQMIVSLPKLDAEDDDGFLSNIWLPFKRKRTYNLRASKTAFILVKFYETVTCCYHFQKLCQDTYNHKFKEWILENIQVHFSDEQFYPGLGAVLRIYENLRRGKKSVLLIGNSNMKPKNGYEDGEEDYSIHSNSADQYDEAIEESEDDEDDLTLKQNQQRGAPDEISNELRKKCKPKPKSKPKSKCKPKTSAKNHNTVHQWFHKFFTSAKQKKILKYIGYILALILLILLLILLICLCIKCIKKLKKAKKSKPKQKAASRSPPGTPEPKKRDCMRFCPRFCRKKKAADEEILIKPESNSIVSASKMAHSHSSTSSIACRPKTKCLPCPIRGRKKSGPAVIETTSLDCSSSEAESGNNKTGKQKLTTVNEKHKTLAKSKSRKGNNTPDSSDNSLDRKGRKKSPDNVKSKEISLSKARKTKESKSFSRSVSPKDKKSSKINSESSKSKSKNTISLKENKNTKTSKDNKLTKQSEATKAKSSSKSSKDSKLTKDKELPRSVDRKIAQGRESPKSILSKESKDSKSPRSDSPKSTSFKIPKNIRNKCTWEHIYNVLSDKKSSPSGRSKTSWETLFDT